MTSDEEKEDITNETHFNGQHISRMLDLFRANSEHDFDHEKAGNHWPSGPPCRIGLESLVVLTTWLLGQVLTRAGGWD